MSDKTLADGMVTIARHEIRQMPFPQKAVIRRVHDDGRVDIIVNNNILKYVECVGKPPVKGNACILIFLNNDSMDYMVIV